MHLLTLLMLSAAPNAQLWLERGGNFESMGNERFVLRWDGRFIVERGRAVQRKDARYGTVLSGACDRFTWRLDAKQLARVQQALAAAQLTTLEKRYRKAGVEDGAQAGLVAVVDGVPVIATFDNEFPAPYVAAVEAVRALEQTLPKVKPTACDSTTWFFLRPPAE